MVLELRCLPRGSIRNLSRLLLLAMTRAEALSVREMKTFFCLKVRLSHSPSWEETTVRQGKVSCQHCIMVLLMVCDSLALGPSLQTWPHVEEKH